MEINVILSDGKQTHAFHINPTDCELLFEMDGSLRIKPKDSAWAQVSYGLDVDTDQQIDPTVEPWPAILAQVAERQAAAQAARDAAAAKNREGATGDPVDV
jgi:hypothetical protein